MDLLANDIQRNYRIDIETNSTVDAEATEDKQNMGEFLNAIAQFMNGVTPMIKEGVMPFEAAKSILLAVTRRYRFGPEVEDDLQQMQAPKPPAEGDDGTAAKAKMEVEAAQAEGKVRLEMLNIDKQIKEAEAMAKMEDLKRKTELANAQHAAKLHELRLKMAEANSAGITQQ